MRKLMKRVLIVGLFLTLIAIIYLVADSLNWLGSDSIFVEAGNANWSETETGEPTDPTNPQEEYTYTVVEIVPYKGLGEMGFLAGGEEPINLNLLPWEQIGIFSPINQALKFYRTYEEASLGLTDPVTSGWYRGYTYAYENGYFEYVGNNSGTYNVNTGSSYAYVGQGNGDYTASLNTETSNRYNIYNVPTNYKNINAYFVSGQPSGIALYSTVNYKPTIVEENLGHGDYDYDFENKVFVLNKGVGKYDVIFEVGTDDNNISYHMLANPEIVYDNSGEYSFDLNYTNVGTNNGAFAFVNANFYYNSGGAYRWVQSDLVAMQPTIIKTGDTIKRAEIRGQSIRKDYQFKLGISIVNNEWLKRYTLGIPSDQVDNYKVDVITITPQELNLESNQKIIKNADIFYINQKMHNVLYVNVYEKYTDEGIAKAANYSNNTSNYTFASNDLSWKSTEAIFKRLVGVGGTRAAVVFDVGVYSDALSGSYPSNMKRTFSSSAYPDAAATRDYNGYITTATLSNLAKLYLMMYQTDIGSFYNSFMNPATLGPYKIVEVADSRNPSGTTGGFVRPDWIASGLTGAAFTTAYNNALASDIARYWNTFTFFPYVYDKTTKSFYAVTTDISTHFPNLNILQHTTDLHENMLVMNGREVFANGFASTVIQVGDADELANAIVNINSINPDGTIKTSLTISDFINVITNNGLGYESAEGVNQEDENGENGTSGSNLRTYKTVLNIEPTADFTASVNSINTLLDGYNVKIVNMTTAQFNGSLKDINTHYDMIYMGCGVGRFNYSGENTIFNNAAWNSSIYNLGDTIKISGENKQYTGNDITPQKMEELRAFIKADYPIVVEDNLYKLTKVMPNTNMSALISGLKSKIYFLNLADKSSGNVIVKALFYARLTRGLNTIRPMIKMYLPTTDENATLDYLYVDPITKTLNIKFALRPRGILPSMYTYAAHLYLDVNGDGIFVPSEELEVLSSDGSNWNNIRESYYKAYLYQYDMSELNGVYQWKVSVLRNDNTSVRSEITGYAVMANQETINILHIMDNTSGYNLQTKIKDTGSLYYKYASDISTASENKMDDYKLNIVTMTVDQFELQYDPGNSGMPYDSSSPSTTNQLSGYHLLIIDNPTDAISNTNGAVTNIKDEIENDLGMVFTKGALGYTPQTNYYSSTAYSFIANDTYARLTRMADSGQYYIFNDLVANGSLTSDNTYHTTYVTKSNEGTVTRYPYSINTAINIAANSYSNSATIDLDIASGKNLIGWYCLSDSKSPEVRTAGLVTDGTQTDGNTYKGIYSSSPNDAKNNYYLFSNDGCYYTGIHLSNADITTNDNEVKLFVNTLIAAAKSKGRVVSIPPVIEFTDPEPEMDGEGNQKIIVQPTDIIDNNFVLTFEVTKSSSNMALKISWNDADPTQEWNEKIYSVDVSGNLTATAITIDSGNKDIATGKYAVKIPSSMLTASNLLKITAVNQQDSSTTEQVTIAYPQNPKVTIIKPVPMVNSSGAQYIYMDIDFDPENTTETYLDTADKLRLEVLISDTTLNVMLDLLSGASSILVAPTYDIDAYPIIGGTESSTEIDLRSQSVTAGSYAIYLPVALLKNLSSRDITINAKDNFDNSGGTTVTLLRRNLFPYD